ncbi:MAG TPA: UDP-N-acetylmuramate--L-alanine ligase [Candidatus Hydrogenedentes bacterium]|nr:UDP-N-acetylmuramate--L-alanine ligase [Candidatus Hydrogenedentota bacterium]HPG68446.1 UDP-N-acetylmuramate--L-alanine ligase [Candidatus Hydrogenedentota bacterium]
MNGSKRSVHFVGVGGIGMSGLAEILLNLGYDVSGSDLQSSPITARLEHLGLRFREGHAAENVGKAAIVVVSAAVPAENVEVVAARDRRIPVIHRSDLLADLIRLKPNAVVVGGTHGKTTTTSMISAFLDMANMGATSIVGGILHRSGTNARWGAGNCLVAEADEHDGSFLRLQPTISVVTNIDAEHLEYYGTVDRIKQAFADFCNAVPFYGYSILCADDANTRDIIKDVQSVCLTYSLGGEAALVGSNVTLRGADAGRLEPSQLGRLWTRFDVTSHDERLGVTGPLGPLEIRALGEHNVRNALAACAVGLCLGMRFGLIAEGLRQFDGVQRRLQVRGEVNGVVIVEDYAHHPTEMAATIAAARCVEPRRVVCVFQPHLFSRTKFLYDEFAKVLASVDRAIVTDIYPAREAPMAGVTSGLIVDAAREQGAAHVTLTSDMLNVPEELAPELEPGDVVLVLGAGTINRICDPLIERLRDR